MKFLLSLVLFGSLAFAKVDINHATKSEFQSLSGIGAKKAESIVNYREKHGCFENLEALMSVSGIGKSIFAKLETELEITECIKEGESKTILKEEIKEKTEITTEQ